jgi:uroporphyrinogen III methyltransferase/synthase
MTAGKVWLVGAGPGDPGLLTIKGAQALAACDVLLYDYLVTEAILQLAAPFCERIFVGKRAARHAMPQTEIIALMTAKAREGKNVVRLKGGDVFVFARGGEEAAALAAAGIPFEIVPGVSSAIAVPAAAGIPVTHRDHNTAFTVVAGHEDPSAGPTSLDYARLADPRQTLIFLMAMRNLRAIANRLIEAGLPPSHPVAIVREGTRRDQQTIVGELSTIAGEAERQEFTAPAVIIIGTVVLERPRILATEALRALVP